MTDRNPSAPSHLTMAMTRRLLARLGLPLSVARIWELCQPGRPLETEVHEGTRLIPRWRLMQFLDARGLLPETEASHG